MLLHAFGSDCLEIFILKSCARLWRVHLFILFFNNNKITHIYLFISGTGVFVPQRVWRSEANLGELVSSSHCVGLRDQFQVVGLGSKHLYLPAEPSWWPHFLYFLSRQGIYRGQGGLTRVILPYSIHHHSQFEDFF